MRCGTTDPAAFTLFAALAAASGIIVAAAFVRAEGPAVTTIALALVFGAVIGFAWFAVAGPILVGRCLDVGAPTF